MSLVNDALKKARMEAARGDAADRNLHYRLLGRRERETSGAWIFALGALVLLAGIGGLFLFRSGRQSALKEQVANRVSVESESASAAGPATETIEANPSPEAGTETASPAKNPAQAVTTSEGRTPAALDAGAVRASEMRTTAPVAEPPSAPQLAPTVADDAIDAEGATSVPPDSQSETEERVAAAARTPTLSPTPSPAADSSSVSDPTPQEFLQRADIPGVGPIELGGIAWSGDRPFALVNGRVVRPGDSVSGLIVDDIQRNTVRLRGDNGTLVFRLK